MPSPRSSGSTRKPAPSSIYQLKITLKDSAPPIWRRVQVSGATPLPVLHVVFQLAMGWEGEHLHQYVAGRTVYTEPMPGEDNFDLFETKDERRVRLSQIAPVEGARFSYQYDFGDSWDHAVLVERAMEPEEGARYPRCLAGRRACPPEDCGGMWGYYDLLETLAGPNSADRQEIIEWLGGEYDPAAFSVDEVNKRLEALW
jgi:Plasmid pRiA4b ORF-3-like protein